MVATGVGRRPRPLCPRRRPSPRMSCRRRLGRRPTRSRPPPRRCPARGRARSTRRRSTRSAAATAERTQVLDAMIALRHDHDAARAGRLLDHYLVTHPHGALREEALALAIEAATARNDGATAHRLAASYLDGYPRGRFRDFARDTLSAGTP